MTTLHFRARKFGSALLAGVALTAGPAQAESSDVAPAVVPPAPAVVPAPPAEVVVRVTRATREPAGLVLGASEARSSAGTAGDPVKVVEALPGVARAPLGSQALVLWGAAPDETRFAVDGVEIPELFHGGGIRSTINGDLLQSLTLAPGAYGADYGRGIGGQVRLTTRELPDGKAYGNIDLSTLDGAAFLGGRIGPQVRVALAARYGWLDRTLELVHAPLGSFFAVPRYKDYQAKVQVDLEDGARLDVVALGSADDVTRRALDVDPARDERVTTSNGFQRLYLHYQPVLASEASLDVVPWIGRDTKRYAARFGNSPADLDERTDRVGLRAEYRSLLEPNADLRLGVDAAGAFSRLFRDGSLTVPAREGDISVFGQAPGDDTNSDRWRATVLDIAPYASLEFHAGSLTLTPQLRLDGYLLETSRRTPRVGQTPSIGRSALALEPEPRLAARFALAPRVALLAALGLYSQPPAPRDLSAVFGTPTLGPERAEHVSFGESVDLTSTLSTSVLGFYEAKRQLVVRDENPTPRLAGALLQTGRGRSYGVQLHAQQRLWRGFSGWVAYTISRSERQVAEGASFRLLDADQPHVLSVVASQALADWTFGLRLRYASGAPRTPVTGALYDSSGDRFQPIFGPQNSIRLPAFSELDVRVERHFQLGTAGALNAYLEVLNVTDHENAEEYAYTGDYAQRGVISGLPIVGVAGARLEL